MNSDMSFMPLYPKEGGSERLWNNAQLSSVEDGLNVEILGYSGNWYEKEDETKFYEGIDTLAQEQALKSLENINNYSVGWENPFPYVLYGYADPEGYLSTHVPFDIYPELSVESMDETVSVYMVHVKDYGYKVKMRKLVDTEDNIISALMRFTRPDSNMDIGPMYYPFDNESHTEYKKVDKIVHEELKFESTDGKYDIYRGETKISSDVGEPYILNKLNSYKGEVEGCEVRTDIFGRITINGTVFGDISRFFNQIPQKTPSVQIDVLTAGYAVDGMEISESDFKRILKPIPFLWTHRNGLSGEEEEIVTDVVSLSGGCYFYNGTKGDDIVNVVDTGDTITT